MMRINKWLVMAGVAATMCMGTKLMAQGNGGGGGYRNMSPEERMQARLDRMKETLEVTDDKEWAALKPLVQKVTEAQMAAGGGRGFGFGRRGGRGGGDNGGDQGGGNGGGRGGFTPPPNPERDALQRAIDAKAPKAEIKAALDKYVASRKAHQATLEKAQADLRKVLTSRQEAIATLNGLL